jgi:signal transduction histidine kinase/ligand-binding sensor domain-containing protein/DNA-binding response OmpR family regulator
MRKQLVFLQILCIFMRLPAQEINFEHIGASNGLSQISVMSIYQDELGYMWFGTGEGLNRYDGKDIEVFRANENDELGLTSNVINKIHGDQKGNLYILSGYKHLVSYDILKNKFTLLSNKCQSIAQGTKNLWYAAENKIIQYNFEKKTPIDYYIIKGSYPIKCLFEASNGKLYIGTETGLCLLDENKIFNAIIPNYSISTIYEDSRKNIWVGTTDNGVFKINRTGLIDHYSQVTNSKYYLSSNIIRDFCEDNFGQIWIATFTGLDKLTPENGAIVNYKNYGDKPTDLSHTSIYALYKDKQGTIWIGTYYGGINYYNPEANIYTYYYPNSNNPRNINFPIVGKMAEDKAGNLWICTEGGGLNYFNRKNKTFQVFKSGGSNSISHNNLKCIWFNPQNDKLYIGTHLGGLSIYNIKSRQFKELSTRTAPQLPNNVIEAMCPYKDKLIVLTQKGIVWLDLTSETISPFVLDSKLATSFGNQNTTLFLDSKQNLWLAQTDGGVKCYNMNTKKLLTFTHSFEKPGSIGRQVITRIYENKRGRIFFATRGSGLFEYLPENRIFMRYSSDDNGLLSNFIYDITETTYGYLVLLTNKGVNLFDTESNKSIILDKNRGLPLDMINFGCGIFSTRNGEIFVGGTNGMASFFENQINPTPKEYNLFFSDLYINNQLIRSSDGNGILEMAMPYLKKLTLNYKQANITIKFATSNYIKANNTSYEYKLEGLDEKWIPASEQTIKYNNLSPGSYVLHVREALGKNSTSVPKEILMKIRVSPPFYASFLAYLLYIILIGTGIWRIMAFNKSKILLKTSLDFELRENDRIQELNQTKLRFFTNISHEFRTPLTLIIGQIESMTQMDNISPMIYGKLAKVYKNASHLRNLITELLDFRKQERDLLALKVSNLDIVDFTRNIYRSFNEMATSRKIDYNFISLDKNIMLWFDPIQLQKVFYNLISNAFKYTKNNNTVTVKIEKKSNGIRISVIDSGVGISDEELPKVFERFYQAKNQNDYQSFSTGVGLALSKGIVDLHHGIIEAEKNEGAGTTFRVTLLTGSDHFTVDEKTSTNEIDVHNFVQTDFPDKQFFVSISESNTEIENEKSTILIVEDNEEMLQFLSDIFSPIYHVETAIDGLEGMERVKELQPDIVLSDVMMPVMSGKEMCMKLKSNFETSHIPIVLLTADSSEEQNLEGLMVGADDYVTKPFNVKALISRCNNLVVSRKRMQDKYSKQTDKTSIPLATNKMDQDLLNRATQIVTKHIDDSDFDVSVFASEMALGRSKLYLKLKGITGMTPNDFILNIRLKTAATMLKTENDLNISDITYRLGFSTPRYFSKCFKELFGISPLIYRKANNPVFANKDDEEESEESDA